MFVATVKPSVAVMVRLESTVWSKLAVMLIVVPEIVRAPTSDRVPPVAIIWAALLMLALMVIIAPSVINEVQNASAEVY